MAGYIYREDLLERLQPLLELLNIKPETLVTLRINPRGIDYRTLPSDPFAPLGFTFYNIADRDHVPPPVTVDTRTEEAIAEKAEDAAERASTKSGGSDAR